MNDANPPSFQFHRNFFSEVNSFPLFIVEEIHPDNQSVGYMQQKYDKNKTVWKIVPNETVRGTLDINEVPPIIYGQVPRDFIQEEPKDGPAPSLEPGKVYEAGGAASLMPWAIVRFKIENGKIIQVPMP